MRGRAGLIHAKLPQGSNRGLALGAYRFKVNYGTSSAFAVDVSVGAQSGLRSRDRR